MKYRIKKTIDAVQWNGKNQDELKAFAKQFALFDYADTNHDGVTFEAVLKVRTVDKIVPAQIGDYVVHGEKGDFFVIAKTEFEELYEKVI